MVEYAPSPCFAEFVNQVSEARRAGDVNPAQSIIAETFKLIGNSSYGSLIMDKEKHKNVRYIEGKGRACLAFNDPRFRKATVINENLYEVETAKRKIKMDLPIQLGYHILQLAKLRMLQFKYDFLEKYCLPNSYEYVEMDTDSAYMAIAGKTLDEIIKPSMLALYNSSINNRCDDIPFTAREGFFPRRCCSRHIAFDKRTPGLFKVEAEGNSMIALCSKTYILKQSEDQYKFSSKGVNKNALTSPFVVYKEVLESGQPHSATNQGFQLHKNTIYTYEQQRSGISYFYCKRIVLSDGVHTKPLDVILSPWDDTKYDVVDATHPWSLTTVSFEGEFVTLAEVCKAASESDDPQNYIRPYLTRLKAYKPKGELLFALTKDLKRTNFKFWCQDSYWTTGLSPRASTLRTLRPGQNILGRLLYEVKVAPLMDHTYHS